MIFNLIILGLALAGIGMLWREILGDSETLSTRLKQWLPRLIFKSLDCPFCFTFWMSLLVTILLNPLASWSLPLRFPMPNVLQTIMHFLVSWFAVGTITIVTRALTEQIFHLSFYVIWILKQYPSHKETGHEH